MEVNPIPKPLPPVVTPTNINRSHPVSTSHATAQQTNKAFIESMSILTPSKQHRVDVQAMVSNAAQCIAPVWPLETFIACNPLQGLEALPFEEALLEGKRLFGSVHALPKLELVNRELIKWCGALLDRGQGTIEAPNRDRGFYAAFLSLCTYDHLLHQGRKTIKSWLNHLPKHAEETILICLNKLGVAVEHQESFVKDSFACLPGWAGYIKWCSVWKNTSATPDQCPVTLVDFLAVRLVLTVILWPEASCEKKSTRNHSPFIQDMMARLNQSEQTYQHALINQLMPQVRNIQSSTARPNAQLVFCIDVRSEPLRRSIESLGDYETLGFAGFFGIPARIHDFNSGLIKEACPVLLKPRYDIKEQPVLSALACVKKHDQGKKRFRMLKNAYYDLKYNFSTSFALVETLGVWSGIAMLAKTLAPNLTEKARACLSRRFMPFLPTQPMIQMESSNSLYGISPSDQVLYGEAVLKMMGLTHNFAKLVVFCGHRSTTRNNPYASALDCGACGGNHGGSNAKILATVLNTQSVRDSLGKRGIVIPDDTLFYAAEHDTTTDEIKLYETVLENQAHQKSLQDLKHHLRLASQINARLRCQNLGVAKKSGFIQTTLRLSSDWAEVRPEWGLARNAAFIIGPRQLTKHINLEGRCFLHSYEWGQDENGGSLETILTAPMVVAQWINTQYLFSTLDNVCYGSGSKITHNVTGQLGVMQGNGSDLMHGLPLQSVCSTDKDLYHEPQRLLTLVYAPKAMVNAIIARQDILKTLFFNGWVTLVVIEPGEEIAYQLDREGNWHQCNEGE